MIQTLEHLLRSQWSTLLPGRHTPQKIRVAILATSREVAGTRILLLFADHDPAPSIVGKVPRHPQRIEALEREWALLNLLHTDMPEMLLGTLPRPLLKEELHGLPVYLQTALPGQNLKTSIQRRERPLNGEQAQRDLAAMAQWLVPFHSLVVPETLPEGLNIPVEPSLADALSDVMPFLLTDSPEASLLTPERAERLMFQAQSLDAASHTRTWVHGDLWPGNVLVDGKSAAGGLAGGMAGGLAGVGLAGAGIPGAGLKEHERWTVLDWDGLSIGSPWQDRVWFALHYGMLVHAQLLGREDLQEGLRRTLFMQHPVSDAVLQFIREGIGGEGQDEQAARHYVGLLLAIEAGRVLKGSSRRRAFDMAAPVLLKEWEGYPEQIRL